ncbi:hypothetical protein A9Q86_05505 [Flavobacteriales bacterium 33_180_T64]|nr:hypothetical protein A9Q86_05505 [Flavobacteriales bacterium 33_180_T64]
MAVSPLSKSNDIIRFEILSNGISIPVTTQIIALHIQQDINRFDEAVITLIDGSDGKNSFPIANSNTFKLGNSIEIKLGYHAKIDCVFKGKVIVQKLINNSEEGSQLQIICKTEDTAISKVRKEDLDRSKSPVLELTYGYDVIEFQLQIHAETPKRVDGFLTFQGFAKTNVNNMISIKGFADKFNKNCTISKVIHQVKHGSWHTTAYVGNNLNNT